MSEPPRANRLHADHAPCMLRRMAKLADCGTLDAVKHPRQHGLCRLPDDAKDHGGDDKADDRVGKRVSQPHAKRAKDDRQAGEPSVRA